ncbi:recombinase family protein [Chloroflexota bacterium]
MKQVTRVGLYSRVSTQEQELSLGEQRERLELLAKLENWQVYDYYQDEGVSGGTDNRTHLQRLMADARAGRIDLVVVTKLDRFFRNTRLLLNYIHELEINNVGFTAQAEGIDTRKPGIGNIILALLGSIAEWERERIGQRISDFRNHLASQGRWSSGRVQFGYRFNRELRELEIYQPEADVVIFIFRHYLADNLGLVRLAELLNAENMITPRWPHTIWTPPTVRRILTHPAYMGGPNTHWKFKCPVIVDRDTWEAVQRQLTNRRCFQPAANPSPYQGLLRCGICGHTLRIGYSHNTKRVWECPGRLKRNHLDGSDRCALPRLEAATFEEQLNNKIDEIRNDPELFRQHLTRTLNNLNQERVELERRLKPLRADMQRIESSMSIADAKLEAGRMDGATYKATIAGLRAKRRELERRQDQADPMMLGELERNDELLKLCKSWLSDMSDTREEAEVYADKHDMRFRERLNAKNFNDGQKPLLHEYYWWKKIYLSSLQDALKQFGFAVEVHPDHVEVKGLLGKRQSLVTPSYT